MKTEEILIELTEHSSASAFEDSIQALVKNKFEQYTDNIRVDKLGNVIAKISANKEIIKGTQRPSIMIAAHADEIGFMVSKIEKGGFLRVVAIGGIDPRTIIGQEALVHGREQILGVFGAKPPHLLDPEEAKEAAPIEELFIDIALNDKETAKLVQIGDWVTIKRQTIALLNNQYSGKAMDDRAGLTMLFEIAREIQRYKHEADIYLVSTVQEEIGVKGGVTASYGINPDIGIAIDVTHGTMPGVESDLVFELGKGPAISMGPNIHPKIFQELVDRAKDGNISYQIETSQGPTGTDARAMQITRAGIATGLVSIPLRYMHTSVETLDINDIKNGGKLLALFIEKVNSKFVEELKCY